MNHENLETWGGFKAREYHIHQEKLRKTLLLGIVILIGAMYVLFFVGDPYKWPLIGALALAYIVTRAI